MTPKEALTYLADVIYDFQVNPKATFDTIGALKAMIQYAEEVRKYDILCDEQDREGAYNARVKMERTHKTLEDLSDIVQAHWDAL